LGAGLKNVYNMEGGIRAWQGMVAHGIPEAGMAYFSPAANAEELVGLAWSLEEGSKIFYQGVAEYFTNDSEAHQLFTWLVEAEKHHEEHLLESYKAVAGQEPDFTKLRAKFSDSINGKVMEGGIPVQDALNWAKDKGLAESLELAISMEANAFDLYVKMSRKIKDAQAGQIFEKLAEEEQMHLKRLAELLDKNV
jgi:rubrerythrin